MAVAIYMDVHIPRAITLGLRIRGTDIVTAQEDNSENLSDSALLTVLPPYNAAYLLLTMTYLEAKKRQKEGAHFSGVIYAHPLKVSIGRCNFIATITFRSGNDRSLLPCPSRFRALCSVVLTVDSVG